MDIKTYIIKLNSEGNRRRGLGWVLLEYPDETLSGKPIYINASSIKIYSVATTYERENQYFIKVIGHLVGDGNEYKIL